MNWDALGAIGEIIGAVAVVVTLLYLAVQIRQNTLSQRVVAKQEMTQQFTEFIDFLVLNPKLGFLHDKGLNDAELTNQEKTLFTRIMAKAVWQFSVMHFQYRIQNLTEGDWEESRSLIEFYCSKSGFQKFWLTRARAHGPEFLNYIDNEIEQAKLTASNEK